MTDRMSAAEYQRLVVKPARDASADDDEFIKQLQGVKEQKKTVERNKSSWKYRTGVAVFQGKKKIDEKVGDWQPVKKQRNNEEDQITMAVSYYLEELKIKGKVLCYSHIPNSTFTRSWSVKTRNKDMGVRAGVPDMLIVFPDQVLFLELKRLKGGVLSAYQKEWIEALAGTGKVVAKVAAGFDEAKAVIDSCLLK